MPALDWFPLLRYWSRNVSRYETKLILFLFAAKLYLLLLARGVIPGYHCFGVASLTIVIRLN